MKDLTVCKGYVIKTEKMIVIFESRPDAMKWIDWYMSSNLESEPVAPSYTIYV